jgi:hypothetical protein
MDFEFNICLDCGFQWKAEHQQLQECISGTGDDLARALIGKERKYESSEG